MENEVIYFKPRKFLLSLLGSHCVIGGFWTVSALLQKVGCPFPSIEQSKFLDLGLFTFSNFSFITFLAMIPFQQAEGKLSPGFYARIFNRPMSHLGLSILLSCFVLSIVILSVQKGTFPDKLLSQLFIAMLTSMVFAVIFQRNFTLRYLHQPFIVYENLAQLAKEENVEGLWLDLYECNVKAIKEHRIHDARNFSHLMAKIYTQVNEKGKIAHMQKDLRSLYQSAKDHHPLTRQMEKHWPFLCVYSPSSSQEPMASISTP